MIELTDARVAGLVHEFRSSWNSSNSIEAAVIAVARGAYALIEEDLASRVVQRRLARERQAKRRKDRLERIAAQGMDSVIETIASVLGVTTDLLVTPSKVPARSRARYVAATVLRSHFQLSYPTVGHFLKMHHTTAIDSVRFVEADARLRGLRDDILGRLTLQKTEAA